MKKQFLFLLMSLILLTGCRKDDDFGDGATLAPVPFTVQVKYDANVGGGIVKNATVTLKNNATGETLNGTTNDAGELKLSAVLPGQYNLTSSIALTQQQYYQTFGITTNREITNFNGSQENVTININVNSSVIVLSNGTVGDFVIKQYYYAGSNTTSGALFRDQFIEIHNNSNGVLYADGLYIAMVEGNINNTVASFTLPNGQLDWSKSTGNISGSAANTDYVYSSSVIKLPGSGTQYPVQPGASIVIAQTGINHKAPYTNNNGDSVSILDPSLTVDLSTADFETYLGNFAIANGQTPFASDVQNPAVKDAEIAYWTTSSRDWLLNVTTRPALVIFNGVSNADFNAYGKVPSPKDLTGRLFIRIPKTVIMDGVDTTSSNLSAPKDLQNDVDAGLGIIKNAGGLAYADYTSYSVIRKTKSVINGRTILEDTNNSTNDFVTIKATPKAYAP